MNSGDILATFLIDSVTGRVTLRMQGHGDLELGWREGLRLARPEFDWTFDRFRRNASELNPDLATLTKAIRALDYEATQMAFALVDDSDTLLTEIRGRFRAAWPEWESPVNDVVPIVEVIGHDDLFAFELLPIFSGAPIPDFANYAEAETILHRFLGFGAAVRRVGPDELDPTPLDGRDGLPVQFFRYEMPGALLDEAYFEECGQRVVLDGHWPLHDEDPVERIIGVIYDPHRRLDTDMGGRMIEVQHFSCHCDTSARTATGYTLILGGPGEDAEIRLPLGALRYEFSARSSDEAARYDGPRPLVVLSACASSRIDPGTARSFHKWFTRNRCRAFVGTETDIPDAVGAAFTRRLYGALLDGRPLSEALVLARRRLMGDTSSPLGLLYVVYGNADLALASA